MFKVLVADPIAQEGVEIFKKEKDIQVDVKHKLKPEELKAIIGDYDALAVRSETKVTADILSAAVKLKVIGRAGVGVDNVDVPAASKKGIIVMNTPDGNTISTAEHTFSMIMALSRNIPQADASMRAKRWDRKKYMGVELYGKILGVIGTGRIGREVSVRAKAFNMEIVAYDPYLSDEMANKYGIKKVTLEELVKTADYITVHTPLTSETKHLVNEELIAKMKDGVRLINCARGGIIKESALVLAVKSGKVAGAALDVYESEPPDAGNELFTLDKIIFTPHLGASTEEAQISVAVAVASQMIEVLRGGTVRNAVNIPAIPAEILKQLKPYIELCEIMGKALSQTVTCCIKKVTVEYRGQVAENNTSVLSLAVIKGVLTPLEKESVNFVNAPILAKDKGIVLSESKTNESSGYASLVKVELETENDCISIAGTVFGRDSLRIVQIRNYDIDLEPAEKMLVIQHNDKPGLVGNIGTLLGNENINIASLQLARKASGGDAIAVLTIDHHIGVEILMKIAKLPHIKDVKYISL
ncbi:MAG: phosphoglycerate dehydrogenase [Candidatus Firestonebacteria bacterium]